MLKQVKRSADADCGPQMLRLGYLAMKNGCWKDFVERYGKEGKSSEWTFERVREAYERVAKDEIGRLGIVQEILRKSTDFLRRIIAPVDAMGGVTLSYVCPHCNSTPLENWVPSGHDLINALKLLANQQKDGDSSIQSIVIGLHERSIKGITEGLRSFIEEDNHRAVDVGHLHEGIKPFYVRKPKFSEDEDGHQGRSR